MKSRCIHLFRNEETNVLAHDHLYFASPHIARVKLRLHHTMRKNDERATEMFLTLDMRHLPFRIIICH